MNNIIDEYNIKEIKNLYVMNEEDISKFAESATLAYKEYPLFKYLTKNKIKHNVIKNIIKASISSMKGHVLGLSTEEDANAIAIFVPPNYRGTKVLSFLMGGRI